MSPFTDVLKLLRLPIDLEVEDLLMRALFERENNSSK